MNCPKCGVDMDVYLREEAERQDREKARARREKEFEQTYGHIIRLIRKKRAWIGGITGFVAGILLFVIFEWLIFSHISGGVKGFWEEITKESWYLRGVILLMCLMPGILSGWVSASYARCHWGRRERELRKSFGL